MSTTIPATVESVPAEREGNHPADVKYSAVQKYLALGNMRAVSELSNIPYPTLCSWKRSDWWGDVVEDIRREERTRRSNRLQDIVDNSLNAVEDRLKNGDYVLNQKTGKLIRKPVAFREAAKAANDLLNQQTKMEELAQRTDVDKESVGETLKTLAAEFAKFNKKIRQNNAIDIAFEEK